MTDLKTDNTVETDLKIEKVISRGEGVNAQVLLVLVSSSGPTQPGDDIWVAIAPTEPLSMLAAGSRESTESCGPIATHELELLDLNWEPGTTPFGLDCGAGRSHWLARFDFSDHPRVQGDWLRFFHGQEKAEPETLSVFVWRSHVVRRPAQTRDAKEPQEADFFEPRSAPVTASVRLSEVVVQPPFELGVLFVHGIGEHGIRETLVRYAEPLVRVFRERGFALNKQARKGVLEADRHRVWRWLKTHQLRNRAPIDGITDVASDFATLSNATRLAEEKKPLVRPTAKVPTTCCAVTRPEQTLFAGATSEQPSAALLRLSTVDTHGVLRESHALFAEAYWTREAFPPTRTELYFWLTTAIPIAVWARMHRLTFTRRMEIRDLAREAKNRFEWFRFKVSALLWLVQLPVVPAAYLIGAIAGQVVLGLVSLVGVLPVPWLQRTTRAVVTALMGTLGQSFALQTSAVRRSAIVSVVTNNLNWLSDRCHRVVVMSHSQGAEIARLAFLDGPRKKVARWYTFGAGIAPLSMLHPRSLDTSASRGVVVSSKAVLIAVAVLLIALGLEVIPGVDVGVRAYLAPAIYRWGLVAFLIADVGLLAALFLIGSSGPEVRPNLRRSLLGKWRDVYASQDPVPGGSLINRFAAELRQLEWEVPSQRRIYNTRLTLFDHTSYWQNIEQFVAPLAIDLLHLMGKGGHYAGERAALDEASRRRDVRTWWNVMVLGIGLAAFAASVLWTAFGPAHRGAIWAEQARVAWSQGSGFLNHVPPFWNGGFFGQVISDLWLPLLILPVLGAWWVFSLWLSQQSEKALIKDLAAAARTPVPR